MNKAPRSRRVGRGPVSPAAMSLVACLAVLACSLAVTVLSVRAVSFRPRGAAVPPTRIAAEQATPAPLASKVRPPSKGAYLGIFHPPAPFKVSAVSTYTKLARKAPSIVMWFQSWSGSQKAFDKVKAVSLWERNIVPLISWEPWAPGTSPRNLAHPAIASAWRLKKITAGKYDGYITSYARAVKAAGGPVMISPFHEMNGRWYPWGGTVNGNKPADLIRAWRHVHHIFHKVGASNVTWVWSLNNQSIPTTWRNRWAAYYPGDAYVDWVGMSGYNWGRASSFSRWHSFEHIDHAVLSYLKSKHKPVIITEIASVEQGGNKASWLSAMFRRIRAGHPEVKAVIYYDAKQHQGGHTQDWRINSTKKSLAAYRAAIGSSYWVGVGPTALSDWFRVAASRNVR